MQMPAGVDFAQGVDVEVGIDLGRLMAAAAPTLRANHLQFVCPFEFNIRNGRVSLSSLPSVCPQPISCEPITFPPARANSPQTEWARGM